MAVGGVRRAGLKAALGTVCGRMVDAAVNGLHLHRCTIQGTEAFSWRVSFASSHMSGQFVTFTIHCGQATIVLTPAMKFYILFVCLLAQSPFALADSIHTFITTGSECLH